MAGPNTSHCKKETRMNALTFADELQKSLCRTQPETDTSERIKAAREILLQGLELLFELGDGAYSEAISESGVSIGDLYGQGIQHFRSLIQGYHSGEIRYSAGEPDRRLRTDVVYASIATCDVLRALKRYPPESLARECLVVRDQRENRAELPHFASTFSNELAYCTATAMLQYAAIRGICEHLELAPLRDFGRANGDGLTASNSNSES
jgi:hypothetical protein